MLLAAWSKLGADRAIRTLRGVAPSTERALACGSGAVAVFGDARLVRAKESISAYVGSVRPDPAGQDLDRLEGDFAFVRIGPNAVDCVRGRVGGHPLFLALLDGNNTVVASSHLQPLLRLAEATQTINVERLALWVGTIANVDDGESPYREVHGLLPGEVVSFAPDLALPRRRRTERRIGAEFHASVDELAEELRARILASVRRAVEGRSHVAILAGGGLDSSGLVAAALAVARGASPTQVTALALDFASPGDDRPHLRSLAASLGIVPLRLKPEQAADLVRPGLVMDGAPNHMHSAAWEWLMMREARSLGAQVVLTGIGGDDVFEGDPRIFGRRARRGSFLKASIDAARLRVYWTSSPLKRIRQYVIAPILRPLVPQVALNARRRRAASVGRPWMTARLRDAIASAAARAVPGVVTGSTPQERFSNFAYSPGVGDIARRRSQLETVAGVQRIDPYLDEDLLEFMVRVPPEQVFVGHQLRGLLRHALRGWIPDSVRLRIDKAEFAPALIDTICAADQKQLQDLASGRELAALELVNSALLRQTFDVLLRRDASFAMLSQIWAPLSVEAFLRCDRERRTGVRDRGGLS